MQRRILRWEVPVDDQPHKIGGGRVVHVAIRPQRIQGRDHRVEVWTDETLASEWPEGPDPQTATVQVFGTGQRLPETTGEHVGAAIEPDGVLVWHVVRVRTGGDG
jgi:hypothetical protein